VRARRPYSVIKTNAITVMEGDYLKCRGIREKLSEPLWGDQPLPVRALEGDFVLRTPPRSQQVMAPRCRIILCESILAGSHGPPGRFESIFHLVDRARLPSLNIPGIVSLIVAGMEIDPMMCPALLPWGGIIQRRDQFKVLALVCP
jgi:hypothetical protein